MVEKREGRSLSLLPFQELLDLQCLYGFRKLCFHLRGFDRLSLTCFACTCLEPQSLVEGAFEPLIARAVFSAPPFASHSCCEPSCQMKILHFVEDLMLKHPY
uniref:Myb family transcription factor APL isoform X2 n=1 Tax=Rhizophora mucronata TaxID=61149 RepID=A0A2P2J7Z5_RHIMU